MPCVCHKLSLIPAAAPGSGRMGSGSLESWDAVFGKADSGEEEGSCPGLTDRRE